jgi:hypothetical protein
MARRYGFFIDPPSPYAPLSEMREFLDQMRKLPQDDESVRLVIREVEENIAEAEARASQIHTPRRRY